MYNKNNNYMRTYEQNNHITILQQQINELMNHTTKAKNKKKLRIEISETTRLILQQH